MQGTAINITLFPLLNCFCGEYSPTGTHAHTHAIIHTLLQEQEFAINADIYFYK